MTAEDTNRDTADAEDVDESMGAVSSSYKILGEFSDASGAGVLGKNTAGSGTPIGIEGAVPNTSGGFGVVSRDDAKVEGSLDVNGGAAIGGDVTVSGAVNENSLTQLQFGSTFSVPDSTEKRLEFSDAPVDEPSAWDDSNYEYVAPDDGKYQVNLNVKFSNSFSSDTAIDIRIRASSVTTWYQWSFTVPAGTEFERSFSTVITGINATAPFYFTVEQNSGSSRDMTYGRLGTNANVRYLGN